jgi:hypothetical protein
MVAGVAYTIMKRVVRACIVCVRDSVTVAIGTSVDRTGFCGALIVEIVYTVTIFIMVAGVAYTIMIGVVRACVSIIRLTIAVTIGASVHRTRFVGTLIVRISNPVAVSIANDRTIRQDFTYGRTSQVFISIGNDQCPHNQHNECDCGGNYDLSIEASALHCVYSFDYCVAQDVQIKSQRMVRVRS